MPESRVRRVADFRILYVAGAGGQGREVAWLADTIWSDAVDIRFVVDDERYLSTPVNGISVQLLSQTNFDGDSRYVVAIGDPPTRRRLATALDALGAIAATLVHPRAELSGTVSVAAGAVIAAGTVVTTNVAIGAHAHVNVGSTISHDVTIGSFVTLSPGVHIAGHVNIESDVLIGIGATVINGSGGTPLVIGAGATIGAGACVIRSVPPGALITGVPGAVRARRPGPAGESSS